MEPALSWAPREQHEEADALTNEEFSGFDPDKRVVVQLQDIKWIVLKEMMEVSELLYAEVRAHREGRSGRAGQLQKATGGPLRERDPW